MEIDFNEKVCPICGYEFPVMNRVFIIVAVILLIVAFFYMIL